MSRVIVFSSEFIRQVWDNGISANGADPGIWQKDLRDTWIKRGEYGKRSEYGWRINHSNHRPIHWKNHERTLEDGLFISSSKDKENKRAD